MPPLIKVLVAPDKFKGSLTAAAAAGAIARGWREAWEDCELTLAPIADGGEGFAEIFQTAMGAEWVELVAQDPLGRPVAARYAWVTEERLAILEMSEASGLWRLQDTERAPLDAHTFGTGQLIRHAAERGAQKILVGLGGSATTDGGAGMAAALGYRFHTPERQTTAPVPRQLAQVTKIDAVGAIPLPPIIGACDVTNPLLGPRGTARVFSPQKGADPATVETLERSMTTLADLARRDLGTDFRETPGAGAAGGFGFGLLTFCGGTLRSGFEVVAEAMRLEEKIAACDLVITGEGRLDFQTLEGKGPAGVAALAQRAGKPVLALAGSFDLDAALHSLFDATCPIIDTPTNLPEAMAAGEELLARAAGRAARLVRLGATRLPAGRGVGG